MGTQLIIDGPYATYKEYTGLELDGKENYLVELAPAEDSVRLLVTPGKEIGTVNRIDKITRELTVRLLNAPGKTLFVQDGAIAAGATFKAKAGGKVTAANSGDTPLGRKDLPYSTGADGDIITGVAHSAQGGSGVFITSVAVANTGTPDGVAHITGQVKDANGNNLAGRFHVILFTAATAYGAVSAQGGTAAAGANTRILVSDVANASLQLLTHSDGSWAIDVTTGAGAETVNAHAAVTGIFATAGAAITGN